MAWYTGTIPEAIQESQLKKRLFVVYVKGVEEEEMDNAWENTDIMKICTEKCVVLKIVQDSIEFKQFTQFYPVLSFPSTFCIGLNGAVIEGITSALSASELKDKLNASLKIYGESVKSQNTQVPTSDAASGSNIPSSSTESKSSEEEKKQEVLRMQEKINKIRLEKKKQAEDTDRKREIERREIGKKVQELKQTQADLSRRKAIEERKKMQREDKEARERVKRLLEQDRLDKKIQREKELKERDEMEKEKLEKKQMADKESKVEEEKRNLFARIQFRMGDGTTLTHQFKCDQLLSEAAEYLCEQRQLSINTVQLSSTFPRRVFTKEDHQRTLKDLSLSPSAVLLVTTMTKSNMGSVSNASSGIFLQIWSFIMFILMLPVNLIKTIFPTSTNTSAQGNQPSTNDEPSSSASRNPSLRHRGPTKDIRRQGNMTRLGDVRDDNDEDNTWNGNSTQQM